MKIIIIQLKLKEKMTKKEEEEEEVGLVARIKILYYFKLNHKYIIN
jgi:hypothetical protein